MQEIWKQHPEYPTMEFSTEGNVRKWKKDKWFYPKVSNSVRQPYLQVNAAPNVKLYIHREIGKLFVPNPKPDEYNSVLHIDNNHLNNTPGNLYWGTQAMNMADRKRAGNYAAGTRHFASRLKPEDVFAIRLLRSANAVTTTVLGRYFGLHPSTISNIACGRYYKDLGNID
jgi:hypothetical protein